MRRRRGGHRRPYADRPQHQQPAGSTGGLPQDPQCDDTRTRPDGTIGDACLESSVGTCNLNNLHPGVCNSPVEYVESGTFPIGGARLIEYLTLQLVTDVGPDGQQCTADDTYSAPADVRAFLTTGVARATVFDANNTDNNLLDHAGAGCSTCITQVTGAVRSCSSIIVSGRLTNMKVVTSVPFVDLESSIGDAAATVEIKCL